MTTLPDGQMAVPTYLALTAARLLRASFIEANLEWDQLTDTEQRACACDRATFVNLCGWVFHVLPPTHEEAGTAFQTCLLSGLFQGNANERTATLHGWRFTADAMSTRATHTHTGVSFRIITLPEGK